MQEWHDALFCPQKNQHLPDGRNQIQDDIEPPLVRVREAQGQSSKTSGNKVKENYIHGRLNHMELSTACEAQKVVFGLILINSIHATVLFDSSSSHSFISSKCVAEHKIHMLAMRKPMLVHLPRKEI